jgi:hypothetical protein
MVIFTSFFFSVLPIESLHNHLIFETLIFYFPFSQNFANRKKADANVLLLKLSFEEGNMITIELAELRRGCIIHMFI